ncbi:MAG: cation diffusion facilitator family transporter [Acidimicrobiia bacterium]
MPGHQHHHAHDGHGAATPEARRRALGIALAANALLLVVQLVAAIALGSLALLADTAHLAADVVALVLAMIGQVLSTRPAKARTTYGWERAEVLAATLNSLLLTAVSAWVVWEAVRRYSHPHSIDGAGVAIIGGLGLAVNAGSAWGLARTSGASINLRAAFWHLASDALGSLGVVVAGVALALTDATWIDPTISIGITLLVVIAAWSLLRDAISVLLERAPRDLDPAAIEAAMLETETVEAVHHVHVWSLGSETPALSAHVVLRDEPSLHAAQLVGDDLRSMLAERFGVEHSTLELECHDCAYPAHSPGTAPLRDSHP